MPTRLTITDEKKHSVRYDHKGTKFNMSVYVHKDHPVLSEGKPWPEALNMELTKAD